MFCLPEFIAAAEKRRKTSHIWDNLDPKATVLILNHFLNMSALVKGWPSHSFQDYTVNVAHLEHLDTLVLHCSKKKKKKHRKLVWTEDSGMNVKWVFNIVLCSSVSILWVPASAGQSTSHNLCF